MMDENSIPVQWWLFAGIASIPRSVNSDLTTYEGCYKDILRDERMSAVTTMTECRTQCTQNFWRWAGVTSRNMCSCSYTTRLRNKQIDDKFCKFRCEGNATENCGGNGFSYIMHADYNKGNMAVYKKATMSYHAMDREQIIGSKNPTLANDGVWPNEGVKKLGYHCLNHFRLNRASTEPLWWKVYFHDHPFPVHSVQVLTPDTSPKLLGCYTLTLPRKKWKKRPGTKTLTECANECTVWTGLKRLYAAFHIGRKECYCAHKLYKKWSKFKQHEICKDGHYELAFASDHPGRKPLTNIKFLVYSKEHIQTECFHWEGELPVNKATLIKCKPNTLGNTLKISTLDDNLSLCEVAVYFMPIGCFDQSKDYAHSEKLKVTRTGKRCRNKSYCKNSPAIHNMLWCYLDKNPRSTTYELCDPPKCTDDTYEVIFRTWTPWFPCDLRTHTRLRVRSCTEGSLKGQLCHVWKKYEYKICQDLFPNKSCKEDDIGTAFKGKVTISKNGFLCQPWDWSPNKLSGVNAVSIGAYVIESHLNYCRNPDRRTGGPWCFLYGPEADQKGWDFCDIPRCRPKPISQDKPTRQSGSQTPRGSNLAVDGNRDHNEIFRSCAHAMSTSKAWWEVDLESEYKIAGVTISSSLDVPVPPINAYVLRADGTRELCFTSLGVPKQRVTETPCRNPLTGKIVRIESMQPRNAKFRLCEVEVRLAGEDLRVHRTSITTTTGEDLRVHRTSITTPTGEDLRVHRTSITTPMTIEAKQVDYTENDKDRDWFSAEEDGPNITSIETKMDAATSTYAAVGCVVALAVILALGFAALSVRRKFEAAADEDEDSLSSGTEPEEESEGEVADNQ